MLSLGHYLGCLCFGQDGLYKLWRLTRCGSPLELRILSMRKILLISLVCLIFVVTALGQQGANYNSADEIERDLTFLLLEKNINDVTRQLDSENAPTVASLLRRLVIHSRAGHASQVRATLEQLAATPNWQCPGRHDLTWLIKNISEQSFVTQRLYYERLCPDAIEGAEAFVRLWSKVGDLKELDAWLAERSNRHDDWLMLRVQVRARSGTAGELLDALAAEVRANPSDWTRLDRYLRANSYTGSNIQDVSWLAETFEVYTASDHVQLGGRLRAHASEASVKLLQRSLELPFTDADAKFVNDQLNRFRSIGPAIKVNWEKQLRYWTKRSLAETYLRLKQPLAAQPLVEELVSMKGDDIVLQDVHQLAGAVQGDSGQRVVETKILRDEVARRSTAEYWLERAKYYEGRKEYELERESFRQALIALETKPDDRKGLNERYMVVWSFAMFLAKHNREENRPELEKLLTTELNSTPLQTLYAFQIARLITDSELDLDELRNSLLAKQPALLARFLAGRREWGLEERSFIETVVNREAVPSFLKNKIWTSLEALATDPGSTRAFHLAEAMKDGDEWQRAIPLWRGYIQHAHPTKWEGYKTDAITHLFTAYCRTGQWQTAEKFLFAQLDSFWRVLPKALAEIAVAAAQANAIDDAMRLWRMSANIDRRNLEPLPQLAQTKLKPQLLAMYSQMKKEDPLSTVPDLALQMLQ